jgi:DNA-binding LacI/PurR family transcriptional regulator
MTAKPDDATQPHFLRLAAQLRDEILSGVYQDGDRLPPEAELGRRHAVSRVTVRKALDELKRDHIIKGMRGSGTVVTLPRVAFQGAMEMVILVAPSADPFFAAFQAHFDAAVERHGAFALAKQDPSGRLMTSPEFYRRFLSRGIRDFVLWPRLGFPDASILPRLRGLGANLVFFDHVLASEFADCVALDNDHAIRSLHEDLRAQGARRIDYVGWADVPLSSTAARETAFRQAADGDGRVFHIERARPLAPQLGALIDGARAEGRVPDGYVCINSSVGSALCAALVERELARIRVGMVDDLYAASGPPVTCLVQPLKRMAEVAFECLREQNKLGRRWKARRHALKGTLRRA